MLSRTAASLYWIGRYMERAEFTTRLVEATIRLAALGGHAHVEQAWLSALERGAARRRSTSAARGARARAAILTLDTDNPSSIRSCIVAARDNARAARTALTREVWEAINRAWLMIHDRTSPGGVQATLNLVEELKAELRGFEGALARMLRNEGYWFMRLGSMIERGDATARLLDVKYYLLLPEGQEVGGALDRDQWTTILQIVSAKTAYRHLYREALKPWLVADMLIFRRELPRSLAWTAEETVDLLGEFGGRSGRQGPADRLAPAAPVDGFRRSTSTPSSAAACTNGCTPISATTMRSATRDRRPVPVRLMQLTVRHVTTYTYAEPARGIIQLLRATPASFVGQNVLDWRIDVDCDARLREGRDGYGNITHMLYVDKPVRSLSVSVNGRVLTEDRAGVVQGLPHDLPPQIFLPLDAADRGRAGDRRARPLGRRRPRSGARPAAQSQRPPLRDDALRHRGDRGRDQRRAGRRRRPRRLPGFRAYVHRRGAGDAASRPATCPAICSAATAPTSRRRRTPGPRPGSAISAGSPSIRPTAFRPTTPMSASPAGSTIATPRRSPAHVRVAGPRIWR